MRRLLFLLPFLLAARTVAATTVVILPGLGGTEDGWGRIAAALSGCAPVVLDLRPEPPAAPVLTPQALAAETMARLHAAGTRPPWLLLGHSLGGLIAQAIARAHPEQVAAVVLVDTASPLEPPGVFVSTRSPPPGSRAAAEEAGAAPGMAAMLAGPPFPDLPLLVLAATDHADTPAREALWQEVQRRTAALSPRGRLMVAEGSGHDMQRDRPEMILDAVRSLLGCAAP